MLHDHGLSIPYDRVPDISAQLGDAAVARYVEEGVVCLPILRKGLFSTSAMDNIDHNPSSKHGGDHIIPWNKHIHLSTFRKSRRVREPILIKITKIKKVPELPDSHTNVYPAFFTTKNPSPPKGNVTYESLPSLPLTNEYEWLQKVSLTQEVHDKVNITWSSHHAEKKRGLAFEVSITALLPLLRDEAHSVATVRHSMNKVRDTIAQAKRACHHLILAISP